MMNFHLVFDNSGDSIKFDAVNPDIVEYYLDCVSTTNHFWPENSRFGHLLSEQTNALHSLLTKANSWLEPLLDQRLSIFDQTQYLDQDVLNLLHAQWVALQSKTYDINKKRQQFNFAGLAEDIHNMYPDEERYPKLMDVATKLGYLHDYDEINHKIHFLEHLFSKMRFMCSNQWLEFENIFGKDRITNDICNLYLPFRHLGRSQWNKFNNFDQELQYNDENTFNQLLKFVELNLLMPQTMPYSSQYLDWCNRKNKVPSGELIPLGNIPDLYDNVTNYRIIVFRNLQQQNKFSLYLKG